MVSLLDLWLPILVAAVIVLFVSAILHTAPMQDSPAGADSAEVKAKVEHAPRDR